MYSKSLLPILLAIAACHPRQQPPPTPPPAFETFEVSYSNGWDENFTFALDSTGIYLSPRQLDTVRYGLAPDSLRAYINTVVAKLRADTAFRSSDLGCADCPLLSLQAVRGTDTLRMRRTGSVDRRLQPLVVAVRQFLDTARHGRKPGYLLLPTRLNLVELPPKIEAPPRSPEATTQRTLSPQPRAFKGALLLREPHCCYLGGT